VDACAWIDPVVQCVKSFVERGLLPGKLLEQILVFGFELVKASPCLAQLDCQLISCICDLFDSVV
jgi:hypothetical protein